MSLKLLIFLMLLASSVDTKFCEDTYCEEFPDYPLDVINSLELWKYKFPENEVADQTRHKRNEPDANEFLVETKLCESKIRFIKPKLLKNVQNRLKVVVNQANFTQFMRIEECVSENFPCTWDSYPNTIESFCSQNYMEIKLWSLNDQNTSLIMDSFNIPSSCDCMMQKESFLKGVRKSLLQRP